MKIDFNTIIFYFFQMLSAIFLIILTEHVQNLTNFQKKVQFFFYLDTIRQKECENQLNTVIQNFERMKLLITSSKY